MKFLSIASEIKESIETRKYPPGALIPPTKELARTFRASQATIARAMQTLARDGFVQRIKSKGTYVLEPRKKRGFSSAPARRIGFAFHGFPSGLIDTHFIRQAYLGAEEVLRKSGKSIVILPDEGKSNEDYFRDIEALQVGGLLIYSIYNSALYRRFKEKKVPMVYLDFIDYELPVDQVTTDHLKAGAMTLHKLRELGHKKIVFFGNYQKSHLRNDVDHEYWWQAMQAEAKKLRFKHLKSRFVPFDAIPRMRESMLKVLQDHPDYTGYVCASTTYYDLLKDVLEKEKGPGDACDVVLFSDWPEEKFLGGRKVWQCRWDTRATGVKASEVLLDMMDGGPHKPMIHYLPVEIR
jgi:DNA-binding LacI/PurR family transcriptional regulator